MLLHPKRIAVRTMDGETREYIISKFPATVGRDILTRLPDTGTAAGRHEDLVPAVDVMLDIMSYVAVALEDSDTVLRLASLELVNRHVPDWETLTRIEEAMLTYNTSFMRDWRRLDFLRRIGSDAPAEDYRNIDSLVGKVIAGGRATLQQLRTVYTIEDAMHIWEAAVVPEFNDYMAIKEAQRKARR